MDGQADERFLRNIEGYLIELVCSVERMDEVNLVAEVLVSVQDALRGLVQSRDLRPDPMGLNCQHKMRCLCRDTK